MKPTVGSIVLFVQERPEAEQPKEGARLLVFLPAIVTKVLSDTHLNLQVFLDEDQNVSPMKRVTSVGLDPEKATVRSWHPLEQ